MKLQKTTTNRLTVGSGPHYANGWVNLDVVSLPNWPKPPDVLASVYDMPFEDDHFHQIYLGHVLEHLEWDSIPDALTEIKRVAAPDAEIAVVGPCMDLAIQTRQPEWLLNDIREKEPHNGLNHAWTPTSALTLEAMQTVFPEAKLVPVRNIAQPKWCNPSLASWQCAILAKCVR